jgi:hypothetical protein
VRGSVNGKQHQHQEHLAQSMILYVGILHLLCHHQSVLQITSCLHTTRVHKHWWSLLHKYVPWFTGRQPTDRYMLPLRTHARYKDCILPCKLLYCTGNSRNTNCKDDHWVLWHPSVCVKGSGMVHKICAQALLVFIMQNAKCEDL